MEGANESTELRRHPIFYQLKLHLVKLFIFGVKVGIDDQRTAMKAKVSNYKLTF